VTFVKTKQYQIMKKFFIGLLMALMIVGTVEAQEVNLGVKGGVNLTNISGGDAYTMRSGFHLGLLGHIHFTENYALQPEVIFSTQGAALRDSDTWIDLNYLNIPVLFQYMFNNGLRLQAGPQLGLLLNSRERTGRVSVDLNDEFATLDVGVSVGASYIHTASGFGVDARYNHGLTNINKVTDETNTNRGFQVGVFYLFGHRN
jgi:hypothetical protein